MVTDVEWLADRFEEHRPRLRAVAYRMLGSLSEADDAVQEAWIRLNRTDASQGDNPGARLTTVGGGPGRHPRPLAHDGGGADLAQHAAFAPHERRGADRRAPSRADHRPRRR